MPFETFDKYLMEANYDESNLLNKRKLVTQIVSIYHLGSLDTVNTFVSGDELCQT